MSGNLHSKNGFEYALFPAKTEKPSALVIYLHGIGDNASNFDDHAALIQEKIPGADVIALQAPIEIQDPDIPAGEKGYSWFPFGGPILPQAKTLLSHAFNRAAIVGQVERFAKAELATRGLTEDSLAYTGNSMGGIVALQVGLSGKKAPAAVVALGGAVPPLTKYKRKPDVFLQMGEWDELFNDDAPPRAKNFFRRIFNNIADSFSLRHGRSLERLKSKGVPVQDKLYPMEGHILSIDAWHDTAAFIEKALRKKGPSA